METVFEIEAEASLQNIPDMLTLSTSHLSRSNPKLTCVCRWLWITVVAVRLKTNI